MFVLKVYYSMYLTCFPRQKSLFHEISEKSDKSTGLDLFPHMRIVCTPCENGQDYKD